MMRIIVDFILLLALAVSLVMAVYALLFGVADVLSPLPAAARGIRIDAPAAPRVTHISDLGGVCQRDGVLITSMDRLRAAVTVADRMIATNRAIDGKRVDMVQIRADADQFAQRQAVPDVTLEMLSRCDESLLHRYPHGYWLVSAALVRESARRRGTAAHPSLVDQRAP